MLSSSKRCHSNTEEMRALFAASIQGRKAPDGLHQLEKETYIHDKTRPGYPSRVPRVVPPSGVPLYNL